jgi:hypothetical protein
VGTRKGSFPAFKKMSAGEKIRLNDRQMTGKTPIILRGEFSEKSPKMPYFWWVFWWGLA